MLSVGNPRTYIVAQINSLAKFFLVQIWVYFRVPTGIARQSN